MSKKKISIILSIIIVLTLAFSGFAFSAPTATPNALTPTTQAPSGSSTSSSKVTITAKSDKTNVTATDNTAKITYTVKNTGSSAVTNVVVKDPDVAGAVEIGKAASIAAGESKTFTYNATFTRTSTSTAKATYTSGGSSQTATASSVKITYEGTASASNIEATIKSSIAAESIKKGDEVTFTVNIKNTGTASLTSFKVVTSKNEILKENGTLGANNSVTYTFKQTINDATDVYATVSAKSGSSSVEQKTTVISIPLGASASAAPIDPTSALEFVISTEPTSDATTVTLKLSLKNTSEQTINNVTIRSKTNPTSIMKEVGTISAGETKGLTSAVSLTSAQTLAFTAVGELEDGTEITADSNELPLEGSSPSSSALYETPGPTPSGSTFNMLFLVLILVVVLIIAAVVFLLVLITKEKKAKKAAAANAAKNASMSSRKPMQQNAQPQQKRQPELSTFSADEPSHNTKPLNPLNGSAQRRVTEPLPQRPKRPAQRPIERLNDEPTPPRNGKVDYDDFDPDKF